MKRSLYTLMFSLCVVVLSNAQTTILDFESPSTSTTFQYFGSPLDGSLNQIIANPNSSGINTSGNVAQFIKPAVAEVWAGAFSNPNPTTPVNLIDNGKVTIKVHMDHIGSLSLKLENSTDGGSNWLLTVANTQVNQWEELVFDVNLPSMEAPFTAVAKGYTYNTVTLFFDFGNTGTGTEVTNYFDDVVASPASGTVCNPVLDFETPEFTTNFQYFGSTLDGTLNQNIANPNPSGINTSGNVAQFVKPAVAEVWAGAFSNPAPTTPVDLTTNTKIKVKVHMDHIGSLSLKLENSSNGGSNWITTVANTLVNQWEELEFDANLPSIEPPNAPASGFTYGTVVLFFDFGTPGTGTDVTSYFDDICVEGSGGPQIRTVNFQVDMNSYTSNFDQVYLSGTFNNWSGDGNPLSDDNADGIWEGSLTVPVGAYEYKVTLDNWAAQEAFIGSEECTVTDPSGQFVNRRLLVTVDEDVPEFCFNSCYACGDEVKINFRLGMGSVTPNPDGVWLAGGGNFDVPGGKYRMSDDDLDGIYELLVPRQKGFQSYFTFTNGPCADYSCKEDLTGLSCANPDNFNDRLLLAVQSDTTYATCFGLCTNNAECVPESANDLNNDISSFDIKGNPTLTGLAVLDFGVNTYAARQITLTNTMGQTLKLWTLESGRNALEINVSDLAPGLYYVTVNTGAVSQTRKLIRI
jgi:hypothetical protein